MGGGQWGPGEASSTDDEPTVVIRSPSWFVRRTEQLARQLEEAAAFVAPAEYEEGAPRALLVV